MQNNVNLYCLVLEWAQEQLSQMNDDETSKQDTRTRTITPQLWTEYVEGLCGIRNAYVHHDHLRD